MPTIKIYPDCPKPKWVAPGAWCYCLGEGTTKFKIEQVFERSCTLLTLSGKAHGSESFSKLYRNMKELEKRRSS